MFFRNDMIDLEGQRGKRVGQLAVLTQAIGPLSDLLLHGA
jgi:hypothetical protein